MNAINGFLTSLHHVFCATIAVRWAQASGYWLGIIANKDHGLKIQGSYKMVQGQELDQ